MSGNVDPKNIYREFVWESELEKFWDNINQFSINQVTHTPIYNFTLAKYFQPIQINDCDLEALANKACKLDRIDEVVNNRFEEPLVKRVANSSEAINGNIQIQAENERTVEKPLMASETSSFTERSQRSYKQRMEEVLSN
jgi:hypothetical protein